MKTLNCLFHDESASSLIEYSLIIALVVVLAIAALQFLGKRVSNTLSDAANYLGNSTPVKK
jgi:Flp pilus assembly pilin Flp